MRRLKKNRIAVAAGLVATAFYIAYLSVIAPGAAQLNLTSAQQASFMSHTAPVVSQQDMLIIPKIGVYAPINPGGKPTLQNGAIWHRQPQNGNPVDGGNFVLAGHRFNFAPTPGHIKQNSVLYDLDKLSAGDTISVDYKQHRYTYVVTDTAQVKPGDTYIENRTQAPQLTIYSCTLKGSADGRVVVFAQPQ